MKFPEERSDNIFGRLKEEAYIIRGNSGPQVPGCVRNSPYAVGYILNEITMIKIEKKLLPSDQTRRSSMYGHLRVGFVPAVKLSL
jgi:hypothetical protein